VVAVASFLLSYLWLDLPSS